jgi:hypothetical protein
MGPTTFGAIILVILGFGLLAEFIALATRYGMPRAPQVFRLPAIIGVGVSAVCCLAIAWLALEGGGEVIGLNVLVLLLLFFTAQALTWWTFVAYGIYHYWRKRG